MSCLTCYSLTSIADYHVVIHVCAEDGARTPTMLALMTPGGPSGRVRIPISTYITLVILFPHHHIVRYLNTSYRMIHFNFVGYDAVCMIGCYAMKPLTPKIYFMKFTCLFSFFK